MLKILSINLPSEHVTSSLCSKTHVPTLQHYEYCHFTATSIFYLYVVSYQWLRPISRYRMWQPKEPVSQSTQRSLQNYRLYPCSHYDCKLIFQGY
jgi:hypothetical protein